MPTNYTGDPTATEAPSPPPAADVAPVVKLPLDPDPFNAASFYQTYKVLADFIAYLTLHGAWDDDNNTFSAVNVHAGTDSFQGTTTFTNSPNFDGVPAITSNTGLAPAYGATNYREIARFHVQDGVGTPQSVCRLYLNGLWQWVLAVNCAWSVGGVQWVRVVNGNTAMVFRVGLFAFNAGGFKVDLQPHGSANTWADGAWVRLGQIYQDHNAGTITMLLGTTPNTITLDDGGLRGPGATEVSAGAYVPMGVTAVDTFFGGPGSFRKQLAAAPGTTTFVAAQATNVTNGGIAGGYTVVLSDKNGIVVFAVAAVGGVGAFFQVRYSCS